MKKRILVVFTAITLALPSFAWEFPGFEWNVGADVTSSYLWRGLNFGGLALQPDLMVGYGGLQLETWANLSPADWTFKPLPDYESAFVPELDLTLSYRIFGFKVGLTHMYYFDGSKFLDVRKVPSLEDYNNGNYGGHQTEVFAEFNLDEIVEELPLHIGWYTFILGDDYIEIYDDDDNLTGIKRAYSSYFDVSYQFGLPLGFSITPTVGMTPWKGMYNYYEENFSVNNVSLKLNWEHEFTDHFAIDVYAQGMVNTAGINKDNVWPKLSQSYSMDYEKSRRLHFAVGVGIWFY